MNNHDFFVFTYVSHQSQLNERLKPYSWYKDLVLEGAKEHNIPIHYIKEIEQHDAISDPNIKREAFKRELFETVY